MSEGIIMYKQESMKEIQNNGKVELLNTILVTGGCGFIGSNFIYI